MNVLESMLLLQMQNLSMPAKSQQTGKDGADKSSFQELLSQKQGEQREQGVSGTTQKPESQKEDIQTPQEGEVELPNNPEESKPGEELERYCQELLAAMQGGMMPVQQMEVVQDPVLPQGEAVAEPVPAVVDMTVAPQVEPALQQSGVVPDSAPVQQMAVAGQQQPVQQDEKPVQKDGEPVQASVAEAPAEEQVVQEQPVIHTAKKEGESDTLRNQLDQRPERQEEILTQEGGDTAPQEKVLFREVEAVPVKVSDTAVVDTQSEDVELQMGKHIAQALKQGESRVEIKLTPAHLGEVTVELLRSQDGTLHVSLRATQAKAVELLERHASGLEGLLAGSNQGNVHVDIQRQENVQQDHQQQQPNEWDGQNGREQRQQERRQQEPHGQDFLQQLRLGLVGLDGEAS